MHEIKNVAKGSQGEGHGRNAAKNTGTRQLQGKSREATDEAKIAKRIYMVGSVEGKI